MSEIDIRPDPRISNLRPGWLADDRQWRDQLQAMDLDDDIRWIEDHWCMAGGTEPRLDMSWVTVEQQPVRFGWIDGAGFYLLIVVLVLAIAGTVIMAL